MRYITKTVPQLLKGDIVVQHGGRFLVTEDARESSSHRPTTGFDSFGPSDVAVAPSNCIEGAVTGYFWPGSSWSQQGNQLATVQVEVK